MKAWLAWSSGKDSAWSLHVLRAAGEVEVVGLLTTVNEAHGRVAMHDVRRNLLQAQADAVGLPLHVALLPDPCPNDAYEAAMEKPSTRPAQPESRRSPSAICSSKTSAATVNRRWREPGSGPSSRSGDGPPRALAREMVARGLRARVTCVDPRRLDASFAGREFDARFLDDLPAGVDPCGENGEFHTFAWDGPGFRHPVRVRSGAVAERGGFVFADLVPDAAGVSVPASLRPLADGRAT